MDVFALTHKGKVRSQNQDKVYVSPGEERFYIVVADGMGGQQAGQVASAKSVFLMREKLRAIDLSLLVGQDLKSMVEGISTEIFAMAQKSERLRDMGTTFTAAVVRKGSLLIAHVGDSRAYLLREGRLRQVTKDHSYVQLLIDKGVITKAEADAHPYKNMITRALGMQKVTADLFEETFYPGDSLLLCSDGLTNCVADSEIEECLNRPVSARQMAREFVSLTLERGGRDNVSVIIVKDDGGAVHDD